ncbi:DUF2510 domain-containing protein [Arthrobacter sp. KK5.5]|uniref:DUF2510 domain-containing protein n=1 Tax=Arthrobacter sp. KK5.5 TaxID=3373084 RepID=UPI003EE5B668
MQPGWYQQPNDPSILRWWDGVQWTEHTQSAPPATQPHRRPKAAALAAGILTSLGLISAFIPYLSFFAWALLLAGVICAIVALAKRQKLKGLSIASLCVAPVAFAIALVVSLVTLAAPGNNAVALTAGPVVAEDYAAPDARTLALIVKNPEPHLGEKLSLFARISQFDEATGECMFRADTAHEEGEDSWDYEHNVVFTAGAVGCEDLQVYVEDDIIRVLATVAGTESYSGMMGQGLSVPLMQVDEIELLTE